VLFGGRLLEIGYYNIPCSRCRAGIDQGLKRCWLRKPLGNRLLRCRLANALPSTGGLAPNLLFLRTKAVVVGEASWKGANTMVFSPSTADKATSTAASARTSFPWVAAIPFLPLFYVDLSSTEINGLHIQNGSSTKLYQSPHH
jgi:hypothetical protein